MLTEYMTLMIPSSLMHTPQKVQALHLFTVSRFKLWLKNGQNGSLSEAYSGLWRDCPENLSWISRLQLTT